MVLVASSRVRVTVTSLPTFSGRLRVRNVEQMEAGLALESNADALAQPVAHPRRPDEATDREVDGRPPGNCGRVSPPMCPGVVIRIRSAAPDGTHG